MTASGTVSVIVAARDCEDHVSAALDSLLAQARRPNQVLVIDGSTGDATAAVVATFDGVEYVAQRGEGLAAARNEALGLATGEFVGFCDCDDRWTANSLELRLAHLDSNQRCAAVIGLLRTVALPGEAVPTNRARTVGVERPGLTPGALLARREVFYEVGPFDEELRVGCDSDWFARLADSALRLDTLDSVVLDKGVRLSSLSGEHDVYQGDLLTLTRGVLQRRRDAG